MTVVCAWCGKFIRTIRDLSAHDEDGPISHGICPECMKIHFGHTKKSE